MLLLCGVSRLSSVFCASGTNFIVVIRKTAEQTQTSASLTPLCELILQHNNEKLMYCTGLCHTVGILQLMKRFGQTYTSDLRPLKDARGATAPLSTGVRRARFINAIHDAVTRGVGGGGGWGGGQSGTGCEIP